MALVVEKTGKAGLLLHGLGVVCGYHGTLDETVSAMTDAIKVLVEQIPGSEGLVVETLSRYKWPIFARLSAFALKTAPQADAKVVADFVAGRSRFPAHQRIPSSESCSRKRQQTSSPMCGKRSCVGWMTVPILERTNTT
jgi:hypothetical protein